MSRLRAGDPLAPSIVLLCVLNAVGFIALGLAWRGAATGDFVSAQIPFLVSGGLGGVALIGFATGLLVIQCRRWAEANRRAEFGHVLRIARELAGRQGLGER